jgi:hypothetical protein
MLRRTLVLGLVLTAAGCSAPGEYEPQARPTQLAAMAASTEYPRRMNVSRDLALTSTVDRRTGVITIRNFSSEALYNGKVWINENYLIPVNTLGPNTTLRIDPKDVYDGAGNPPNRQNPQSVRKIEIQVDDEIHAVEGPLFE